ncbi:MAG: antibiotic biosynthesis monooxygenase family protein [Hyphomicrobiales bacterium]
MVQFVEMDSAVSLADQMRTDGGSVVLINKFTVAEADAPRLLDAWRTDAGHFKAQPGFISTQLHRGIAGSNVFLNYAVWESVEDFRRAFAQRAIREAIGQYPESAVASPHLFRKLAVPGFCVA